MKSRIKSQSTQIIVGLLLIIALGLGFYLQNRQQVESPFPRARFDDGKPLGGKGYRLVLEWLGYSVRRVDVRLNKMPPDASVWVLLDFQTTFSRAEMDMLLKWVKNGGTLVWAAPPVTFDFSTLIDGKQWHPGEEMMKKFDIIQPDIFTANQSTDSLPPLSPWTQGAPNVYWADVKNASGAASQIEVKRGHLEIAGDLRGVQIARMDYGRGRIFVASDALLFTNYALSKPDNAVLATNLVRAHVKPSTSAVIYFDERSHGDDTPVGEKEINKNLAYYIWRPPLRYAVLQLLFAAVLLWGLFGRRLGSPVPLPDREPVTRASHFAGAMGTLLHKSNRPRAAALILGEEFRRTLARRLGMSPHDSDATLAQRAALLSGLPAEHIERLLFQARTPVEDEAGLLNLTQETEYVLRRLSR
jgi:hypothetical protein